MTLKNTRSKSHVIRSQVERKKGGRKKENISLEMLGIACQDNKLLPEKSPVFSSEIKMSLEERTVEKKD